MQTPPFLCLDIPDLEIQLLRRRWGVPSGQPLLVVEDDRPGARVRSCNIAATALGISPGMRYAEALSRSREALAGTVSAAERRQVIEELQELLAAFLPDVERWALVDSVFWGDARGMEHLGLGQEPWFRRLAERVGAAEWIGGAALGWTRAGTFLAARQVGLEATTAAQDPPNARDGANASRPPGFTFPALRAVVFPDRDREIRWYRSRRISHLPLHGRDSERLAMLGVYRVGELIDLPEDRLLPRFGEQLRGIHRFVRGEMDRIPPRDGTGRRGEIRETMRYEPPLSSATALCAAAIHLLERAIPVVRERGEWIRAVRFIFVDDEGIPRPETIESGGVTRDAASIGRLLAIRLERRVWRAREIEAIEVIPHTEVPSVIQGTFESFGTESGARGTDTPDTRRHTPGRPGENEHKALAILQARFGSAGVFRIELQPGRTPEQRFSRVETASNRRPHLADVPGTEPTGPVSPGTISSREWSRGDLSAPTEAGVNDPPGGPSRIRIRRILTDGAVRYERGVRRHRDDPEHPDHGAYPDPGSYPNPGALPPVRYGPFVYAGEWWKGDATDRIYSYRGYPGGTLLWGYRTVTDARWIVQGWLA